MGQYLAFHGLQAWRIEADSIADARTKALALISDPRLIPLEADEVRVRLARDDELVGV